MSERKTVGEYATEEATWLEARRGPNVIFTDRVLVRKGQENRQAAPNGGESKYFDMAPELSWLGRKIIALLALSPRNNHPESILRLSTARILTKDLRYGRSPVAIYNSQGYAQPS